MQYIASHMNLQKKKMIEINWTVCTWIKMIKYEPVEKNTLKSRSDEQEMIRVRVQGCIDSKKLYIN